jgi:hypothetical protein
MTKPSYRESNGEPTEYGGQPGDNRRTPTGRSLPGSTSQQATDLRREAFRTMNEPYTGREQR